MDKHDVRSKFAQLFQGRIDAYGTDSGGVHRVELHGGNVLERHLSGDAAFGVYPIYDEYEYPEDIDEDPINIGSHVRWGCVDFDVKSDHHKSYDYETEDDAHIAATNLQRILAALDITAWIERTRSCGRHVWIFAQAPVPARVMRRSLLVACSLAEVSTREVNPKSETLAEGRLGNYVRLPFFGAEKNEYGLGSTRVIVYPDTQAVYWLRVFVETAYAQRTPADTLIQLAAHWQEPQRAEAQRDVVPYEGQLRELTRHLDGRGYVVFRDGPSTGDRSGGLMYVAHSCVRAGLTFDQAYAVVADADERWGKFSNRSGGEEQLRKLVGRAYG